MPATNKPLALHLCGSPVSEFYFKLSLIYASEVICPPGWRRAFLVVQPNGQWRFGYSLGDLSEPRSPQSTIGQLPEVDLVVPQMFCYPGMTSFRDFFETVLSQRIVGSPSAVTTVAADKAATRQVVSSAGVRVAAGEVLAGDAALTMQPPLIVKPNQEDNSLGVTLVEREKDLLTAIKHAQTYDQTVLVEEFIAGREIRVAVIEQPDGILIPGMIEYLVNDENPIRTTTDKLAIENDGTPKSQAMQSPVTSVCPALVEPDLRVALETQAIRAHRALGARHYSLFDFRVCRKTNQPYLLEAGLFWSFSSNSMITRMIAAKDLDVVGEIDRVWRSAAGI